MRELIDKNELKKALKDKYWQTGIRLHSYQFAEECIDTLPVIKEKGDKDE